MSDEPFFDAIASRTNLTPSEADLAFWYAREFGGIRLLAIAKPETLVERM